MTDTKIIASRLEALREEMRREHLSAFIFPSSDPHMSMYHRAGRDVSGYLGLTVRQVRP